LTSLRRTTTHKRHATTNILNINSGRKSGKGWHHDNPTEGTKVTGQNTGRVIGYVMQDGTCGS